MHLDPFTEPLSPAARPELPPLAPPIRPGPPYTPRFTNLLAMLEETFLQHGERALFGVREEKGWRWLRYREVQERVDQVRAGLWELGVRAGDRVAVISNNRLEWAVGCFACYGLGAAWVPMYEAQRDEEWRYILGDCGAKVLFVANEAIARRVEPFRASLPALEQVLRFDGPPSDDGSFAALAERGRRTPHRASHPADDAVSHIVYTSGTTGQPKGVLLSHRNVASNVSAVLDVIHFTDADRSVAFLPWAHSFGLIELLALTSLGGALAICDHVDKLPRALEEVQPTVLVSVPRVFHKLYDAVQLQLAQKPAAVRRLVEAALEARRKRQKGQRPSLRERAADAVAERLVFRKVRARFGGRLKYVVSGGAALAPVVAEFIDLLGITVYEGYGLTETSPIVSANTPQARRLGSVGKPLPGVEVRLARSEGEDPEVGEILVRGPNVMLGYHRMPEETARVKAADGTFHTGDLGRFDADGFLHVTGRIKEQYKLENGKYVAPAALEDQLQLSPFVAQVMVHGQNRPYNVAVVVPERKTLEPWAQEHGLELPWERLVEHPRVVQLLADELTRESRAFRPFDRVRRFVVVPEEFSTANGLLTATLKLRRAKVLERYGARLERLYAEG